MAGSQKGLSQLNIDEGTYYSLLSSSSSLHHKNLPVPRDWNPVHRPHVAVLYCQDKQVFKFFLSTPCKKDRLCIWDYNNLEYNSLVEIKYNDWDFRWYRREGKSWALVGEMREYLSEAMDSHHYGYVKIESEG